MSAVAVLVALGSLVQSLIIHQWATISGETRDHFDADIRDVIYDYLRDIRKQREHVTRIDYSHEDGIKEFDKVYDERINPSLVQLSMVLEGAARRYSNLLSGIVYVCMDEVAYEKTIGDFLLEDLSKEQMQCIWRYWQFVGRRTKRTRMLASWT